MLAGLPGLVAFQPLRFDQCALPPELAVERFEFESGNSPGERSGKALLEGHASPRQQIRYLWLTLLDLRAERLPESAIVASSACLERIVRQIAIPSVFLRKLIAPAIA